MKLPIDNHLNYLHYIHNLYFEIYLFPIVYISLDTVFSLLNSAVKSLYFYVEYIEQIHINLKNG